MATKDRRIFQKAGMLRVALKGLRLLSGELRFRYAHDDVLALLGQWPSRPEIEHELENSEKWRLSSGFMSEAASLLSDPEEAERRQRFYPHLPTHAPALLRLCNALSTANSRDWSSLRESCTKLESAAGR